MAVRELEKPPSMAALFARAGAGALPGASRLPFVHLGGRGGGELPDLTLTLNGARVDRGRLADYDRVCGFRVSNELPATYPHMLAFPLQLALMTDASFPFAALGLVHIANEITQHRPIRLGEELDLRVWAAALAPHPRGRQFSLRTEVRAGGELVWEETSTNLRRGGGGKEGSARGRKRADALAPATELPTSATWRLPGDLGRRYGAVSGDMNPIHIHPLSARAFGFPSAIAHGMWTKARCLAALEPQLPGAFTVRVEFRKPIVLPARVAFTEEARDGAIAFGVRHPDKDVSHLDGEVRFR
ncbi:MAG TPA: MaoC/PaaZ C-terminal domain-containing protein [Solirubrobacteraceae bacterium]|nr:MaoC/PaaZ C-terminal domain-containing protein [Solirubrobacteraceae bacterium]